MKKRVIAILLFAVATATFLGSCGKKTDCDFCGKNARCEEVTFMGEKCDMCDDCKEDVKNAMS